MILIKIQQWKGMPYSKDKIMRNRWRNCPLRQKGLAMVEITDLKDML